MFSIPTDFQASLLPASYRGVPFFVVDTSIKSGQRVAEHSFPMRDTPYVEPLGKATRNFTFTAFIIGGPGELQAKYFALMAVIEAPGSGTLIHPVFGMQQVICVQAETTQNTAGRYVEVRFNFVEAGQVLYPSAGLDTQGDTIKMATQATNNVQQHYDDWFSSDSADQGSAPTNASDANPAPDSGTPGQNSLNDLGDRSVNLPPDNFAVA